MSLRRFLGASLGLSLALTVLAVTPAFAQPAPSDDMADFERELDTLFASGGLTAEQAASRAVKVSPDVQRQAAEIDVSIAQVQAAELVRVPRIGITGTYTRLSPIDPVALGPGAAITFPENSYAAQASVAVPLSDYVLRFPKLIDAARLGSETARVSKRTSELDAGQDARISYYEWVRAKLQVMIARRQLAQVTATLGQVRALAEAQRLSKADLMRVESQEAQAQQTVDQLQYLAELREEQLRLLIGAPLNEPLAIGEDIRTEIAAPAPVPLDDLMTVAIKQRPEFRVFALGIRAREKQREAERAALFPQLSAFATADYARPNQRVFLEPDAFKATWQAGLQLSWTLNDALISRANDRRFGAEIRALRADRENLARGTRIAVLAAQQAVLLAQRTLKTSQKGLAAAEESYRVRQALLAAQRATAVELVDAETELTRARIVALNARVDLRVAAVQLAHAIGADAK